MYGFANYFRHQSLNIAWYIGDIEHIFCDLLVCFQYIFSKTVVYFQSTACDEIFSLVAIIS